MRITSRQRPLYRLLRPTVCPPFPLPGLGPLLAVHLPLSGPPTAWRSTYRLPPCTSLAVTSQRYAYR